MKYFFEKQSLLNPKLEPIRIYFNIRNNAAGGQWKEAHYNIIYKDNSIVPQAHPLDKVDNYTTDLEFLCERFNYGVTKINKWVDGYEQIDLQLDPTNINQDTLNQAHHHFETLIGQKWNVSKWFDNATHAAKWAIMELNSSIHNIELNQKNWTMYAHSYNCRDWYTDSYSPHNQMDVLESNKITYDSYKCYQKSHPWGTMLVYYSQTGKPHFDAFEDEDEYVDKDNVTGCRYMSGECIFNFVHLENRLPQFEKWLVDHNYDLDDITECYYGLIVGEIDREWAMPRYGNNEQDFMNTIVQFEDITKVGLADDNYKEICSKEYDWYTWKDQYQADKEFFE